MPLSVPELYRSAVRAGSYSLTYSVSASQGGVTVASGLAPVGGTVTDTTKPGVRRVLNVSLAPEPGLFDLLSPIGTRLTATAHIRYQNRSTLDLPMGVFDVDSQRVSEGGRGSLQLTAPDKWVLIQRAKFIGPFSSTPGLRVVDQIAALIRGALGLAEPVNIVSASTATVGTLTWEKDRDKAILDLAENIGAWVYFDRAGVATIADIPTIGGSADWLIDASPHGVLTSLDRSRDRARTYNVVIISSSASEGELFPTQYIGDGDPASPTYAGPDPIANPELAGPFGVVPYYYDTPVLSSITAARTAAFTILARVTGVASQVSLGTVHNPAIDAFDVLDVLAPRQRADIPQVLERHVVDTVTHPLTLGSEVQIDGRSTRSDAD